MLVRVTAKGRAVGAVHSMVTMRIDQGPALTVSDTFEDREREAKTAFEGCLEVAWRNLEPLGTEPKAAIAPFCAMPMFMAAICTFPRECRESQRAE